MSAHMPHCQHCWTPYFAISTFGLSLALISPSVNGSIPLVTNKERLAFVFSLFRAFSSTASGLFYLGVGIAQERTQNIRGGYYWV